MDARHDLAKRQAAVTRDQRSLVLEGCGGLGHQIDHTTDACCGLRVARMHGPQRGCARGRAVCLFSHACSHSSALRSEEHTSELQSLMRISYAVFCLKKKNKKRILSQPPELIYDEIA